MKPVVNDLLAKRQGAQGALGESGSSLIESLSSDTSTRGAETNYPVTAQHIELFGDRSVPGNGHRASAQRRSKDGQYSARSNFAPEICVDHSSTSRLYVSSFTQLGTT